MPDTAFSAREADREFRKNLHSRFVPLSREQFPDPELLLKEADGHEVILVFKEYDETAKTFIMRALPIRKTADFAWAYTIDNGFVGYFVSKE